MNVIGWVLGVVSGLALLGILITGALDVLRFNRWMSRVQRVAVTDPARALEMLLAGPESERSDER